MREDFYKLMNIKPNFRDLFKQLKKDKSNHKGPKATTIFIKNFCNYNKKVLKVIFLSNLLKLLFGVALVLFLLYKIMGG